MPNQYDAHQAALKEILAAIGARQDCRVWPNSTGLGRALTHEGRIRFGLKGSSDILGLTSDGKMLCIEIKTGSAKRSSQQKAFAAMIGRFGGRYIVASSGHEASIFLDSLNLPKLATI